MCADMLAYLSIISLAKYCDDEQTKTIWINCDLNLKNREFCDIIELIE